VFTFVRILCLILDTFMINMMLDYICTFDCVLVLNILVSTLLDILPLPPYKLYTDTSSHIYDRHGATGMQDDIVCLDIKIDRISFLYILLRVIESNNVSLQNEIIFRS
jgi:hypothetical protein